MTGVQSCDLPSCPSDALALAVRVHVPIFVDDKVMQEAATEPEKEIPTEEAAESPGEDSRLEVFKDFVDKLDLGDIDSSDKDSEN